MRFKDNIKILKEFEEPTGPGVKVMQPKHEEAKLTKNEQEDYRSGVGSLLCLLKHSRPDISNCVRELSKVIDGANLANQKILHQAIKFVEHTKNRELVMKPTNEFHWNIKVYCDLDYAGDEDNMRRVSGYVIYLNNCPIAWKSRGQKTVALSSTEAEYIALSEVSTEIIFVSEVLKFMEVSISYPIEINLDNVGAIYLAKNASTTTRTEHIDIRYHFIREHADRTSSSKTAFNISKGCKTKDHPDGNAASTWERLNNKYEPVSAPTLVKLEKKLRELSLKKGQDSADLDN